MMQHTCHTRKEGIKKMSPDPRARSRRKAEPCQIWAAHPQVLRAVLGGVWASYGTVCLSARSEPTEIAFPAFIHSTAISLFPGRLMAAPPPPASSEGSGSKQKPGFPLSGHSLTTHPHS